MVFASHAQLITLPYFWDEAGQFIPQTWELYRHGRLVPETVTPNVHPPGVELYLAGLWHVVAPIPGVTRVGMLVLASLAALAAFVLAVELCGHVPGLPALLAALYFVASPIFYGQAALAQLDLPAALFTCVALVLFLRDRHGAAALACTALVWTKETGAVLPGVLFLWLAHEKRFRQAALYLLPAAALGGWLLFLYEKTGHPLGSREFSHYNVSMALELPRIALGLARRLWFFTIDSGHLLALVGIVIALRAGWLSTRGWRVAACFAAAHIAGVTVLGGAVLERYLLPVLPLFYAAGAAGFMRLSGARQWVLAGLLAAGIMSGYFWHWPFWPFPYENNLTFVDFVRTQEQAAHFLEQQNVGGRRIVTAWPLTDALRKPELGYVTQPLNAVGPLTFDRENFRRLQVREDDIFVLHSRDWIPENNLLDNRYFRWTARRYLDFRQPLSGEDLERDLKFKRIRSFRAGEMWAEVYARPEFDPTSIPAEGSSSRPSTPAATGLQESASGPTSSPAASGAARSK